ncbi:MAG: hypothetical protein M1831_004109 [Alyxoria varia]|nr:MAG: hypothetical protein M1831_004109 [Alyxoria varia]
MNAIRKVFGTGLQALNTPSISPKIALEGLWKMTYPKGQSCGEKRKLSDLRPAGEFVESNLRGGQGPPSEKILFNGSSGCSSRGLQVEQDPAPTLSNSKHRTSVPETRSIASESQKERIFAREFGPGHPLPNLSPKALLETKDAIPAPRTQEPSPDKERERTSVRKYRFHKDLPDLFSNDYNNMLIEVPTDDGQMRLAIPITEELNKDLKSCLDLEPEQDRREVWMMKAYEYYSSLRDQVRVKMDHLRGRYEELQELARNFPWTGYFEGMKSITRRLEELRQALTELKDCHEREAERTKNSKKQQHSRRMDLICHLYNTLEGSNLVPVYTRNEDDVYLDKQDVPFSLGILRDDPMIQDDTEHGDGMPGPDYDVSHAMREVRKAQAKLKQASQKMNDFKAYGFMDLEDDWEFRRKLHGARNVEPFEEVHRENDRIWEQLVADFEDKQEELSLTIDHGRRWGLLLNEDGSIDHAYFRDDRSDNPQDHNEDFLPQERRISSFHEGPHSQADQSEAGPSDQERRKSARLPVPETQAAGPNATYDRIVNQYKNHRDSSSMPKDESVKAWAHKVSYVQDDSSESGSSKRRKIDVAEVKKNEERKRRQEGRRKSGRRISYSSKDSSANFQGGLQRQTRSE